LVKRKARKRILTRPKVVRRKPVSRKIISAFKHEAVREVFSAILIIAIFYFSIQGTMFIIFRTDSPLRAVSSNSMKPTFERGDLIFIKGVDSLSEIKIHDIIVYQDMSGKPIVHRVVNISQDNKITTKGDANSNNDPPITFEQVKGKVLFWIPKLGYLSLWIQGD